MCCSCKNSFFFSDRTSDISFCIFGSSDANSSFNHPLTSLGVSVLMPIGLDDEFNSRDLFLSSVIVVVAYPTCPL